MDYGYITRAKLKLIPHSLKGGYQWMFLSVNRHYINHSCHPALLSTEGLYILLCVPLARNHRLPHVSPDTGCKLPAFNR